jgi:CheY-like chemotaxis protein
MKSLAVRAHAKGLELASQIRPEAPDFLIGDAGRLRQIIVNLVGNAVKFTEQGEVVLEVARQYQSGDEVVLHFSVTDTGIGIPEEKLAAIFEAFEQVDSSTTRRFGGTGLGLAIASKLVQFMGGRIWAKSEVGRGSVFHFTAPFEVGAGPPAGLRAAPPAVVSDTRVLVVDDNATNRHILEEMLRSWGMLPTTASGVREALPLLREAHQAGEPYALVLTDANMPEVDGFTLAGQVKQDPQLGSTIIMMLTSGDRPGDISRCEQLSVAAYLLKPVKQSELFDAIVLALGITRPEDYVGERIAPERETQIRPLRVLLAEDSLVNQKLAIGLLEKHGHTVVLANDGREAIAAHDCQDFDLVLMDVQMPEVDGFEATAAIRMKEKRTGDHIPIVAMTAHAMKGDRERCLDAGMDDYVPKPIRAKQLFDTIEYVLRAAAERGRSHNR